MGSSEPWMPGERTGGRPRIRLLSRVDTGITPQIAHARAEVRRAFVVQLCDEFAHLWPQPGTVAPGPVERRSNLLSEVPGATMAWQCEARQRPRGGEMAGVEGMWRPWANGRQ